ncbi:predicted protein [Streptomyces albidoflavus]|nr:predicted protein [Streptomyces albidoflavus]
MHAGMPGASGEVSVASAPSWDRVPRVGVGVRLTARALADAGSTGEAFGVYVTINGRMRLYVRGHGFPGSPAPGRPQPER